MADLLTSVNSPSKMLANLLPRTPLTRSWLFEIVDRMGETILESFTLVLPPQSYTITEKQRVTITKTFGNAFVDDYGPDNIEIVLKGISGTARAFPTFQTAGFSTGSTGELSMLSLQAQALKADTLSYKGYNHREAFYAFRDTIMRYKTVWGDKDKNTADLELRVYDLWDEQVYNCVLTEFSVDRTAEHPFHYPFTINLFVFENLISSSMSTPSIIPFWNDPNILLDRLDNCLAFLSVVTNTVTAVYNSVTQLRSFVADLKTRISTYKSQVTSLFNPPIKDFCKQVSELTKTLCDDIETSAAAGLFAGTSPYVFDFLFGNGEKINAEIKKSSNESTRLSLNIFAGVITEDSQTTKTDSIAISNGLNFDENNIMTENEVTKDFSFSGYKKSTVLGNETLQQIALKEYGDDSLWVFIAKANGMEGNQTLTAGDVIYIPVKSNAGTASNNAFIISENILKDPYGQDLKVDATGDLVIAESGDFRTIVGLENIQQAVNNRLQTSVGAMIKQTAFGIAAVPGSVWDEMTEKYLRMSLKMTLLKDPRINSVDSVTFNFSGDTLNVGLNLGLVGYDSILPVDVTI